MLVFCLNIFLGVVYLGVAVIFVMVVYLKPLASEDLFNYLFNVIQFMIVVVSTQFAYKLLVGKKFSIEKVIKRVKKLVTDAGYESPEDYNMAEETGHFIASEILVPHMNKEKDSKMKKKTSTTEEASV